MFEMANLRPEDTGLSVFIWVDEMGGVRRTGHDVPRLKVAEENPCNFVATVSIDIKPKVLEGDLEYKEMRKVLKWVSLNHDLLLKHWKGEISTKQMFTQVISL